MDYLNEFIFKVIPINIVELLAAIAGSYYLKKNPNTQKANKYLVYFLWYTFINEMVGAYAPIAYFSEYKYFAFVKDTVFYNNVWLYNIYFIISSSFLVYYFKNFIDNNKIKRVLYYCIIGLFISSIIALIISGKLFITYSTFSTVVGTILVLISIIYYYFSLLKSDEVINLKKQLPVYISIGVLVFNLCITPIDIFSQYFKRVNKLYVAIRINLLLIANIFMYTTFVIGFLVCVKKDNKKDERPLR